MTFLSPLLACSYTQISHTRAPASSETAFGWSISRSVFVLPCAVGVVSELGLDLWSCLENDDDNYYDVDNEDKRERCCQIAKSGACDSCVDHFNFRG